MANKIAGLQYVDEFTFPAEQGFTGSAGKENVRGYYRGGRVRKDPVKAAAQKPRAPGPGAAHGGYMKGGEYEHMGGEEEYPKSKARQKMPKNVKARGGKMDYSHGGTVGVTTRQSKDMPDKAMQGKYAKKSAKVARGGKMKYADGGSVHDKLVSEGEKMGYAYGGQVKNTSSEFVAKSGKQATMDNADYPPGPKSNQRDVESGSRKKLRPRFDKGGGVRRVRDVRKASKKGMPKGVKQQGGLMRYAKGGYAEGSTVKKREQAGSGIEITAKRIRDRGTQREEVLAEATAASRLTVSGTRPESVGARGTNLPSLASYVQSQGKAESTSTATEEAKAASRSEPSIKQTGVGEHKEATFGRPMKPVMHVKLAKAGGGVVSAAKGGRKKSRKMR